MLAAVEPRVARRRAASSAAGKRGPRHRRQIARDEAEIGAQRSLHNRANQKIAHLSIVLGAGFA